MPLDDLQPGDTVYAATTLYNDGSIPGLAENAIIATARTRGAIVNIGHPEETPDKTIYLVRFENEDGTLGLPVGCWAEEICMDPADCTS